MNRFHGVCFVALTLVILVGCRRKHTPSVEAAAPDAVTESAAPVNPNTAGGVPNPAQLAQSPPTLKGMDANSDLPIAKALAGNDPQAHLRALNELFMAWDQSQDKPLTSPEDFVKVGFLSRLPTPPPGMKFSYNPKRRAIELTPR